MTSDLQLRPRTRPRQVSSPRGRSLCCAGLGAGHARGLARPLLDACVAGQQGLWAGACCLGALLSRAPGWQASVLPSKSLCVKEKSLAQEGDTPGKFRITKDTGEAHCPPHVSVLAPCCSAPRSRWCPTGRIYGGALSRPSGPFLSPCQAWRLWEGDNPTPSWGDPASAWCSWSPRAEPSASRSVPGPLGRPEATTPAPASGLSAGPLKSCAPPLRS